MRLKKMTSDKWELGGMVGLLFHNERIRYGRSFVRPPVLAELLAALGMGGGPQPLEASAGHHRRSRGATVLQLRS